MWGKGCLRVSEARGVGSSPTSLTRSLRKRLYMASKILECMTCKRTVVKVPYSFENWDSVESKAGSLVIGWMNKLHRFLFHRDNLDAEYRLSIDIED